MPPCRCRCVESIEILLGNPTRSEEIVVLFGAGYWRQDIKRSDIGIHTAEDVQMFPNTCSRIVRESNDVREMADNAMTGAELVDLLICLRTILRLVRGQ